MSEDRTRHADVLREVRDCLVGWIERRDRSDPARPSNDEVLAALAAGIEALEAPAPKVIGEAWGLLDEDGDLVLVQDSIGDGPLLFSCVIDAENEAEGTDERPVRVQVVEVPAKPAVTS